MIQTTQSFFAVNRTYDLYELIRGEVQSVKTYIVNAKTVGKKTSIFPTVSFIEPSENHEQVGMFQYVVTEKDDQGEEQSVATSVTFTTGLSDEVIAALDLQYQVDENGERYFDMDRDFFVTRIPNLNVAAAYEKLGIPYLKQTTVEETAVFTIPAQTEETGETMVVYSLVELDKAKFEVVNGTKAVKTGSLMLNMKALVLSFNVESSITNLCENLASEYAVEPISVTIIKQIVTSSAYKLANNYATILAPELITMAEGQQQEQPQATEDDQGEGLVGDETDVVKPQVAE